MPDNVDTVVVGAGTAGCVLAAGLARRGETVLVLEAGPDFGSALPAELHDGAPTPVGGPYDWGLEAAVVGERTGPLSRGRVVGGSAQINDRGAWRPPAADFELWSNKHAAPSWAWDRVLASFVDLENDQQFGDQAHHGDRGPVPVTRWRDDQLLPGMRGLLDAAVATGHPYCADLNAPDARGIGPYPQNRDGAVRASTNVAYLEPARREGLLTVRGDAEVTRVVVRDGRAVGVEVDGEFVAARRVVLAAGAPYSPALLLRSGIGPADELRALGIPVVLDRPGVGRTLRDQPGAVIPIVPTEAAGSPSWPRTQVVARFGALPGHAPDDAFYLSMFSGMPIPQVDAMAGRSVPTLVMVGDLTPASTGSLRLTSADPAVAPEVRLDFYSAEGDLDRMIAAYRGAWEIVHAAPFQATVDQIALVDDATVGSDEALGGLLRGMTSSRWNLVGGADMGAADDPDAVVDDGCAVIGIDGLYVTDLSVVPVALRAPAALTAMMVGRHALDLLPEPS